MIPSIADMLIHINENLDHYHQESVSDSVREVDGVFSASIQERKPHLMLVAYNPDRTSSLSIMHQVTHSGMHAQLIGL